MDDLKFDASITMTEVDMKTRREAVSDFFLYTVGKNKGEKNEKSIRPEPAAGMVHG